MIHAFWGIAQCLKITENVSFQFWHFGTIFDLSGNTVWPQKFAKLTIYAIFYELFVDSNCKGSSLCLQCKMRYFLWFSNTVYVLMVVGPLSAPIGVEGNAFVTSKWGNQSWPDLQITFIASHPGFDGGTVYKNFLRINTKVQNKWWCWCCWKWGSIHSVWKSPKKSHLNFGILAFFMNFCPLKM